MEPSNINETHLWKDVIQPILTILGLIFGTIIGTYKGIIWWIDKKVIPFIDGRFSLLMKIEKEQLEKDNKHLREQIDTLEHDYKVFNEERIKDLKEFIKEYK